MKSLAIRNGDLVVGPGGYQTVEGAAKVKQDLGVALREPFGCDRFHPRWGTILPAFIGRSFSAETRLLIESEIRRTIQNYSTLQIEQIQRDAAAGRRQRLNNAEVVVNVTNIEVKQRFDRLYLRVTVQTLSGEDVSLLRTVEI